MKILFFSHYYSLHIGGVEKHIQELSKILIENGHEITILTERYDPKLKEKEVIDGVKIVRFEYPSWKFLGLFFIWYFVWSKRDLILKSDIVHIHDVFIWYLPFRFLFPNRKVYTTIHGLEWGNPFSRAGILQKKIAIKLSTGTIGIGKFLEKYLGVRFNIISYGAVDIKKMSTKKTKNSIVFVGRLSRDTGVFQFLKWLKSQKNKYNVNFIGDGDLRSECEEFGTNHGFTNPDKFYSNSEFAIPGGYLACLEAFGAKCKVKVFWSDQLKKDYWVMSPMYKFINDNDVQGAFEWARKQSWEKMAKDYSKLWFR